MTSELTASAVSAHAPFAAGCVMRELSFPSLPTTFEMRAISAHIRSFCSAMSFSVSAILPCVPVNSTGIRTEKSPFFSDVSVRSRILSKSRGEGSVALSRP